MDIVMISVDDLINVDRIRNVFGVPLHTPNFDRLKAAGVTFDNAYATVALCNPSRTSIMMSQSPFETGVHYNTEVWYERVNPSETLPALMKNAGFATYGYGKLFHTLQMPSAVSSQMFDDYYSPTAEQYLLSFDSDELFGVWNGNPNLLGDALASQAAINLLQTYSGSKPLFLMLGLVDPHGPFITPASYRDYYPIDQIVVPTWDGDSPPSYLLPFLNGARLDELQAAGQLPELIQSYLANISEMDFRLGKLLDAIDASGRNPSIVLFSDHGYHLGDHDTLHKFTLWEQSASAPLIVVHPEMTQVGVNHKGIVSLLDIAPTVLDMADVSIPSYMQGHSLLNVALDTSLPTSGLAITTMSGSFSLRRGDWRYTRYEDGSTELFRISTDPENKHNLSGQPAYAVVEARLNSQLDTRLSAMGVEYDPITDITTHQTLTGDTKYFVADARDLPSIVDTEGNDVIYSGSSNIVMPGWTENFVAMSYKPFSITGNKLANFIAGNRANDTIHSGSGNDLANGFLGDDIVFGGLGNDTVLGSDGNDFLLGNQGRDQLNGGEGDDTISGDSGDDEILGHTGKDLLRGGTGNDILKGGDGDDVIFGGAGNDRLIGGLGKDRYLFSASDTGFDVISDYSSGDVIRLSGVLPSSVTIIQQGSDTLIMFGSETIRVIGVTNLTIDDLVFA